MKIDKTIERNFPSFASWIRTEIPLVRQQSRILNAFVKFSQLSSSKANLALMDNGSVPIIDCAVMSDAYYGVYNPKYSWNRDRLFVNRKFCRQFENMEPDYRAKSAWGLIMKATILHEMVHWGDYTVDGSHQAKKDIYDSAAGKWISEADAGYQFEVEAFYGVYSTKYLKSG
jgi:hypothetical protein